MERQRTIEREVSISGVGLHTANKVNLTFKPAPENTGIIFIRTDLSAHPTIKAGVESLLSLSSSWRRTSIGDDTVEIHTIEHLMAALMGLGIDNIRIEMDNNEVPGLDGSSLIFLEALNKAGMKEQHKERRYLRLREFVSVSENSACIVLLPSDEFKISYTLSYSHPLLKAQFVQIELNPESFQKELAAARTFCLEEEARDLQQQGLGKGANYENTLVVGKDGVIKNKTRYPDEFSRHKILDLLGDLCLLGQPLKGHIIALKSGHSLNLKLLKKIDEQRKRYYLGGIGTDYQPQKEKELDREEIMQILPHRPPFLFIDKIVSLEKGKHAVGIKNLSNEDYFFKGHFPGRPVMPGVLILEAMAQVGGVMMLSPQENRGKLAFFMAINNVKFRKTVVPGDALVLEVEAIKVKSKIGQVRGQAKVSGKIVAEADLMFALVES